MRSGTHALSILPLAFLLYAPAVKSRPLAGRAGLGIDRVDAGIERDELAAYQLDLYSKKPTKRFDPSAALSNSILLRRADDEHVVSKALKWISNKSGFGSGSKGNTSRNEHDVESQSGSGPDATTRSLQRLHISDPVIVALPTHRYGPHATEHTLSQEARPLMGYDGIPVGHPVKIRTSGMSVDQRLEHWRSKYASGRVNFGGNVNVARPPPLESQAIHAQHPEYRWTNNYYTDHMTRADHDVIFRRPQDFHPSQLSPEKFKSVAENGFLRDEVFMNRMGDGYAWDWYKHYHGVSSAPSSPSAHTPLVQPQRPALRHEGSSLHDANQVSRRDADSEALVRRAEDENLGTKVLSWVREKAKHLKATSSSDHAALSPSSSGGSSPQHASPAPSSSGVSSPHTMPTSPMLEKAEASLSRTADEHSSVPSASASTQRLQITDPVIVAWPDHRISDHMLARPRPDVVPYQHSQSSNWPNLRPRLGPHAPGNARSRAQVLDELTWHYQNLPRERLRELGIIPPALPIRDSRGHDGIPIGKPITFQSRGISLAHQRAVWKARSGSGRNAARNPGSPLRPRHRQSDVHYTDDFHNDYQYCNGPACHVTVFRRPPGFHPSQLSPAQFKTVAEHGFLENSQFVNRMGDADHWKALQRVHGVSSERVHPTRSENHYYVGHIDRRGLGEDVGVLVKLKEKHTREQPERAAEGKAMLTASEARASRRASEGRMGASKDHAPAASARTPDFGIGAVRSDKGASDDHAAAEKVHLDAAPLRMPGPTIVALPPEAMVPLGKSVSRIPQVSETPSLPQLQAVTEGLRGEASSSRASLSSKLRAASGEEHDAAAAAEPDGRRNLEALRISGYPHPVNVVGRPVVIHRSMLSPTSREALLYHQGPPPKPDGVRLEVSQQPATGKVVLFGRPPHFNPRTLSPNSRKVMKDSGLERDGGIAPYKPPHSH